MLPRLASIQQFAARLPGGVNDDDLLRAEATLDDASALVRAEAGVTWVNASGELENVPDVIVTVVCAAARRAFVNPNGLTAESIQDYQASFASASPDVYLTKQERNAIRRAVGRSGLWTLRTTRSDVGGDVPSVRRDEIWASTPEEADPLSAGWAP